MTTNPTLPDDPRDCCRQAIELLCNDDRDGPLHDVEVGLDLLDAAMTSEQTPEPLHVAYFITSLRRRLEEHKATHERVFALVRHGTADHREWDAGAERRMAEVRRAS